MGAIDKEVQRSLQTLERKLKAKNLEYLLVLVDPEKDASCVCTSKVADAFLLSWQQLHIGDSFQTFCAQKQSTAAQQLKNPNQNNCQTSKSREKTLDENTSDSVIRGDNSTVSDDLVNQLENSSGDSALCSDLDSNAVEEEEEANDDDRHSRPRRGLNKQKSLQEPARKQTSKRQRSGLKSPHKCRYCHVTFETKEEHQSHMTQKHDKSRLVCTTCGESFRNVKSMKMHQKNRHGASRQLEKKCPFCKEIFKKKKSYEDHLKLHNNSVGFPCEECGQVSKSLDQFRKHKRTHLPESSFTCYCEKCKLGFSSESSYRTHVNVKHLKQLPYVCDQCGRSFRSNFDLVVHQRTHTGERPYSCDVCGRSFMDSSSLRKHTSLHSNTSPYVCDQCGKTFKQLPSFRMHTKLAHSNERSYTCQECGKTFKTQTALTCHYTACHMTSSEVAISHRKVYQCQICSKITPSKDKLDRHMVVHTGERPFFCSFCNKRFSDRNNKNAHEKHHLNIRPHKCQFCSKAFVFPRDLKKHLLTHESSQKPENPLPQMNGMDLGLSLDSSPNNLASDMIGPEMQPLTPKDQSLYSFTSHVPPDLGTQPMSAMFVPMDDDPKNNVTNHSDYAFHIANQITQFHPL